MKCNPQSKPVYTGTCDLETVMGKFKCLLQRRVFCSIPAPDRNSYVHQESFLCNMEVPGMRLKQ